MAEWLRRWIANPLHFVRVSSNLTGVVFLLSVRSYNNDVVSTGRLRVVALLVKSQL